MSCTNVQGFRGGWADIGLDCDYDSCSWEKTSHESTEVCVTILGGNDDLWVGDYGRFGSVVHALDDFAVACAISLVS